MQSWSPKATHTDWNIISHSMFSLFWYSVYMPIQNKPCLLQELHSEFSLEITKYHQNWTFTDTKNWQQKKKKKFPYHPEIDRSCFYNNSKLKNKQHNPKHTELCKSQIANRTSFNLSNVARAFVSCLGFPKILVNIVDDFLPAGEIWIRIESLYPATKSNTPSIWSTIGYHLECFKIQQIDL